MAIPCEKLSRLIGPCKFKVQTTSEAARLSCFRNQTVATGLRAFVIIKKIYPQGDFHTFCPARGVHLPSTGACWCEMSAALVRT